MIDLTSNIKVCGSDGEFIIDNNGKIIKRDHNNEYQNIKSFDVKEYLAYYGISKDSLPSQIDINDIGCWKINPFNCEYYEKPVQWWREECERLQKENSQKESAISMEIDGNVKSKRDDKVLLLDLDGTVADYVGQLRKDLERLQGPNEDPVDVHHGDYPDYLQARIDLIKNSKDWWRNLPKLEDGFEIMDIARKIGFDIHVLTKGPRTTDVAWTQKVQWCAENLPPETNVTISQDKGLVYGRVLVDDYPVYMENWLKNRPRGLGIMPLREGNKDFKHPNVIHYDGTRESFWKIAEKLKEQYDR